MRFVLRLVRDAIGATAIEYALIAALIAVAAIGAFVSLGNQVESTFNSTTNALDES